MKNILIGFIILLNLNYTIAQNNSEEATTKQEYAYFLDFFISTDPKIHDEAFTYIRKNWSDSFEILAVETLYFLQNARSSTKILNLLERKTGKGYRYDFNAWYEYIWSKEPNYTANFYKFKAFIHHSIDNKFYDYFVNRENQSTIRLDEVRWGGVVQDGIPPLRNPEMIPTKNASYLDDDDIVFGISINGDTRAYPKRILAWHEMFTDVVGDTPVAGVYCTLCGTVILYKTKKDGVQYNMGTSGFLYRSNKLMYDQKTQSLWNTLWGKPVMGPLVGKGIELDYLSVVTTTWGAWKKRHPETTVLSLRTGHDRNYGEGVAYHDYFATDNLMFTIPKKDRRLKNKQEILAIRFPEETDENIAISSKLLQKKHIYTHQINDKKFTVFTDKSGAHRVYFTLENQFTSYDQFSTVIDQQGNTWKIYEDRLENTATKETLDRLQTHNAFWFGYQAAFPEVTLLK